MADLTMGQVDQKAAAVRSLLASALAQHGRVVYANSLGAEAMVLTDIIWSYLPQIDMFSIDTGRLHAETHELLAQLQRRYQRRMRIVHPDAEALERLLARQGVNGFYQSLEARLECCRIRKVEPFRRAVDGYAAWITGVRHDQSSARAQVRPLQWDREHGLYQVSPLLEWSEAEIWQYIRTRRLPYNALHDRAYPSIGCSPCTRATQPGESRRGGRWWWEQPESRECGLHPRVPTLALSA
jgi:phosphoadenosine phosphosulfate reductase